MACESSQKGEVAVSLLMAKLLDLNLCVLKPVCDTGSTFDLGVYVDFGFYRIQVKRAQANKRNKVGSYIIPLCKSNHNTKTISTYKYTKEQTDFVVGVIVETGDFYCFPIDLVDKIGDVVTVNPKNAPESVRNRHFNHDNYKNKIQFGSSTFDLTWKVAGNGAQPALKAGPGLIP